MDDKKEVLATLAKEHRDIPFLKLKRSFHYLGCPTDKDGLHAVVKRAKSTSDIGLLITKR